MITQYNKSTLFATIFFLCTVFMSCSDNYPNAPYSDYEAKMTSIRLMNAGINGDSIVQGVINQDTKMISFPRLDQNTKNLSALKVEGTFVDGSSLEQDIYDFSMDEENPSKDILIKVVNQRKYTYYNMKLRLAIPVWGADFENPLAIYNYSGSHPYSYTGGTTRGSAFDGEYVLIVNRTEPHLLKVSDIEKDEIKPLYLNMTGVSGGTFATNLGGLANGHVYIANLSGGQVSPLKIYYWETPESIPINIASINIGSIPGAGVRHGDNFSLNIDVHGNGYLFFGDNASSSILRLTVSNNTNVGDPIIISNPNPQTKGFLSLIQIGSTDSYLFSGVNQSVALATDMANIIYELSAGSVAKEGMEARMFDFNKQRYLLMTTAAFGGASTLNPAIYVYNFTRGNNAEEAFQYFEQSENKKPLLEFPLGGSGSANPSAQTGYSILKDNKGNDSILYIFGARTESGWALMKYAINKVEDED